MNRKLFWSKVDIRGEAECWPWMGHASRGYGRYNGQRAHRIAYELKVGSISKALVVRHSCDNPICCNPAHLIAGSQAQNIQDAVVRRRLATGARNGRSTLTQAEVDEIRASSESCAAAAGRFGISKTAAHYIRTGRSWKVVGDTGVEPVTSAV